MSYLKKIKEVRSKKILFLKNSFRKEAMRLVNSLLYNGYKCKRIYLYGSVIKDKSLAPWSDIDLVIEGLDKEKFLKAYAFFLKNSRFPIDLKPFEELDLSVKEQIKNEGEIIYEKK